MELPSIAVVTPTLNQAQFLPATLASVLSQDYPHLDYLVMDGGSKDETLAVLSTNEGKFRWISERDNGQSAAINKGWRNTQGEIIAWLNSDDLYAIGALKAVGDYFASHPDIDILYGDGDFIDESGRFIKPYPTRDWNYIRLLCEAEDYILQPAVFMRRRVLDRAGYLDENLSYMMDFEYWLRAGLTCAVAHIPLKFASLRLHSSAKSIHQLGSFADELVQVYQGIFRRSHLPEEIRLVEKKAISMAYHRASDIAFWAGSLSQARQYAWKAFTRNPGRPRRLWLYLLLGPAGYALARRRHPNPYFPAAPRSNP